MPVYLLFEYTCALCVSFDCFKCRKKLNSCTVHILVLILLMTASSVEAQIDTTLVLPTMEVMQVREAAVGTEKIQWESETIKDRAFTSLAEFLSQESNIYVKSQGGNSLGTISIRGASASQSVLLWNGLPVQSPMLGLLDLSLIPLNFTDKLSLQLGGNSSSWGSGAMGGLLSLGNSSSFNQKIELDYLSSIGSFSALQQDLKLAVGNEKFQSVSCFNFQKSTNDFKVRPAPGVENYRQENANFLQKGMLQSFNFKVKSKSQFAIHAWLQESNKELPATYTQVRSEANQQDNFQRYMASWNFNSKVHSFQTRLGHFREKQEFLDPQISLEAFNEFNTSLSELSYSIRLKRKHKLQLTNTSILTKAQSLSYEGVSKQFRTAGMLAYQFVGALSQFQLSIREEVVDKKFLAPVPYVGWQQKFKKGLVLKAKVSREFRLPTLNDLFWSPGGNPNLEPEEGWGEEISLQWKKEFNQHSILISNSLFNRNVKNWILWAPSDQGFFWSANNISKVWSYGNSSHLSYAFEKNKFRINSDLNFDFIRSTYRTSLDLPKIEKGDQLLYTPKFQGAGNFSIHIGDWNIRYQHQFVSETQGANEAIPSYHLGNVYLGFGFKQENLSGRIFLSLNNIYNQNYIVIERRPMPGTNVQCGININFKK